MDFTSGGLVSGNIVVTTMLIFALVAASLRARILDGQGVSQQHCSGSLLVVLATGHGC